MEERLPPEHGSELFSNSLEEFLDGCGVADEGGGHLEASRWDVANSSFDIVGNPLNKVGAVLVLDVEKLFVDFLHRHPSSEHTSHCEVPSMARVAGRHHVPCVEHLLGQLRDRQGSKKKSLINIAVKGGETNRVH